MRVSSLFVSLTLLNDSSKRSYSLYFTVPDPCSDPFRYLIESMFITHADTNLNTMGHVLKLNQRGDEYPLNDPWLIRGDQWCQGLCHPKHTK